MRIVSGDAQPPWAWVSSSDKPHSIFHQRAPPFLSEWVPMPSEPRVDEIIFRQLSYYPHLCSRASCIWETFAEFQRRVAWPKSELIGALYGSVYSYGLLLYLVLSCGCFCGTAKGVAEPQTVLRNYTRACGATNGLAEPHGFAEPRVPSLLSSVCFQHWKN